MPILIITLILIVVGLILYIFNKYLPIDPQIKKIINVLILIVVIVWLLKVFGVWAAISSVKV